MTPASEVDAPTVGIVIPAYNVSRFLAATLDSIRAQSERSWVCVVIDDGSSDDSYRVAEHYAALDSRFKAARQANAGPCVARNHGYTLLPASVQYVTFMDADDVWDPEALRVLRAEIDAHPEAIGAHGLADFIDGEGRPLSPGEFSGLGRRRVGCTAGREVPWPLEKPTEFSTVVTASVMFPPGLMLTRRAIYERTGLFDESVRYAEDWDILIRLTRHGPVQFVNRVILGYRRHANNMGAGDKVPKACGRVRSKAYFSPENTTDQRRIVKQSWRAAQRMAAGDRWREARRCIKSGRLLRAAWLTARVAGIAVRFARGSPSRLA